MKLYGSLAAATAILLSGVGAVHYTIDKDSSIGSRFPLSDDHRTLSGWKIFGHPQLLSDRVILTPGAPGNQRTGLWSAQPNAHDEWLVSTEFRANGGERPGGSLHLWYTARGAAGGSGAGHDSIYTSKPWDGLALVIDSHAGPGGTIRGYLNDGSKDYSQHHDPTSLAFAHCDFDYRNKGALSKISLAQDGHALTVLVNGRQCFRTEAARLPHGYYFGITATTTETPDSFELFNFIVSGPAADRSRARDDAQHPHQQAVKRKDAVDDKHRKQQRVDKEAEHYQRPDGKLPHQEDFEEWHLEDGEEDHEASYYKTQEDQFKDVHSRLQALTHHLADLQDQMGMIYDRVDSLHHKDDEYRSEWRKTRVPRSQVDKMEHQLEAIEHLSSEIAGAMTSKDFSSHFEELRKTLHEHHNNLLYAVPDTVHQVLAHGSPRLGMMVTIVVVVQVALAGCYVIYKRRRNSSPKKYL